jgi:hypothetical protein
MATRSFPRIERKHVIPLCEPRAGTSNRLLFSIEDDELIGVAPHGSDMVIESSEGQATAHGHNDHEALFGAAVHGESWIMHWKGRHQGRGGCFGIWYLRIFP